MTGPAPYDLAVIGGGSGGIAAAKEAAKLGARVVLFDYVRPSPHGTTWGFGGTCVNVGCIPKKLFHYAGLLGESLHDAKVFGWQGRINNHSSTDRVRSPSNKDHGSQPSNLISPHGHDWGALVHHVTLYIKKLNFSYRNGLKGAGVEYINAAATFGATNGGQTALNFSVKGEKKSITAKNVLIATGGRPTIPSNITGSELAVTSDDIFYMKDKVPGKTLIVGGGYIAMEVGGFLNGLGYPVSVAVRSKPLRAFDSQAADKIVSVMTELGVNFLIGKTPTSLVKSKSSPEKIAVTFTDGSSEEYDTVVMATGRTPELRHLELPTNMQAALDSESGKLVADEKTLLVNGTENIYVVGDCLYGSPELTPVAIRDAECLSRRLFASSSMSAVNKHLYFLDKRFIPTTVFTPSEYGCVGLSEEAAQKEFGPSSVDSLLFDWPSLERAAAHREKPVSRREHEADIEQGNNCFGKVVFNTSSGVILGFHFVGPNAGEVTQGFALALKMQATVSDLASIVGIHPTDAEAFTSLEVTKSSGESYVAAGGCGGGKCG